VQFMLKHLKLAGVDPTPAHFPCLPCDLTRSGGFSPDAGAVVLCQGNFLNKKHMEHTLVHELTHMYDHAVFKVDWSNLRHHACSEVRLALPYVRLFGIIICGFSRFVRTVWVEIALGYEKFSVGPFPSQSSTRCVRWCRIVIVRRLILPCRHASEDVLYYQSWPILTVRTKSRQSVPLMKFGRAVSTIRGHLMRYVKDYFARSASILRQLFRYIDGQRVYLLARLSLMTSPAQPNLCRSAKYFTTHHFSLEISLMIMAFGVR
jgi:hypothetical protein